MEAVHKNPSARPSCVHKKLKKAGAVILTFAGMGLIAVMGIASVDENILPTIFYQVAFSAVLAVGLGIAILDVMQDRNLKFWGKNCPVCNTSPTEE